jgi:hypothetical protein
MVWTKEVDQDKTYFPLWHYAIVENVDDDQDAGRIQVRFEGVERKITLEGGGKNDVKPNGEPENDLVWCEPLMPKYLNILPKKSLYSKYIKSTTKSYSSELLTQIAYYFQCSKKEASEYITILSKNDVENILTELGLDDKVKKTLLKELK